MSDVVNVNLKEDDSVQKVIEQTAQKLQNKYKKKRNVNESLLYKKTKWYRALSITLNVLCLIVVIYRKVKAGIFSEGRTYAYTEVL